MAYMLPQFKCPSEFLIRIQSHSILLKSRQPVCFQTQCVLPMTNTMTTIATVDMEKLRLPSFDSHIDPVAAGRPLMFREAISSPLKENLESAFAREMDFTHEKDIVAAAEAVALAKEAAQLAKEVALMFRDNPSDNTESDLSPSAMNELKEAQGTNIDLGGTVGLHYSDISRINNKNSVRLLSNDSDNIDTMDEELKLLQMQLSESIAVRSQRSKDRKTRKPRATGKDGVQIVYANSGPSSRKKRSSMQDIDYSDPLRHLRGTTSTSKLLTAAEESKLSEGIQDLLKLETLHESLAERCGCQPTFAQWAAAAGADTMTLRKRLNYGIFCKDKMIKCNIRLVISVAKNYQGAGMNLQDLIQEGCKGLVRGAEKFDASKGFKFSTYAHWWIKQAVRKSLSDQSRTIRLPFHMVEATYRVKEAKKRIFDEKGRYPDNKEIAEATGLTLKRIHTVLTTPKAPRSLDQPIGIDSNLKPSDIIADPDAETLEEVLIKKMVKQDLYRVLGTLSSRETQVVGWRFGLEDGRTKTLQEIGEMMGVSRERVRQIESCAFRKLKNKKRTKKLQQYHLSHFQ